MKKSLVVFRPRKLHLAIAAIFVCSAGSAQADALQDLTARIDALQKEVNELRKQQASVASAAPANVVSGGATKGSFKLPGSETSVTLGGYVKLDALVSSKSVGVNAVGDQLLDVTSIPVGPGAGANEKDQLTLHARQSRLFLATSTPSAYGEVKTTLEFDLFGTAGNEVASNSHNLRLRHAFGSVGGFLAGQTWSNYMALGAAADTLDFAGPVAVPFVRQAQLRWTQPFNGGQWAVALESPETTFAGPSGAGVRADTDRVPDLTGNINFKTSFGQYWVTGLVRQLRVDTPTVRDSRVAGGIGFSGAIPIGRTDSLGFGLNAGDGIGRYWGGLFPDAWVGPDRQLTLATQYGGIVHYRHRWSNQLRSTAALSTVSINNPDFALGTANKRFQAAHLNLIWSPVANTELGVEYIHGRRELENGVSGTVNRLQASAKYSF